MSVTEISHYYRHLLQDGFAVVSIDCCGALPFRQCEAVKQWRDAIRKQAKLDKISVRTIASPWEKHVLAVRVGWEPGDEIANYIRRLTGVHVCTAHQERRGYMLLSYVDTPFCAYCGAKLEE